MKEEDIFDEDDSFISKSQRKREMHELQSLGEKIANLPASERAQIDLPDELADAIDTYLKITSHIAKKRQLQFIGKVIRKVDSEALASQYAQIQEEKSRAVRSHHLIEQWRDRLIEGESESVTEFLDNYPNTDVQAFRQLLRNAIKEKKQREANPEKKLPPTQFRKLFKFIQQVVAAAPEN